MNITCETCQTPIEAKRRTQRFCSALCQQRSKRPAPRQMTCKWCGTPFEASGRSDCNRRYCNKKCAKNSNNKRIRGWTVERQERRRELVAADPAYHRKHADKQRDRILDLLGGKCVVCGAMNRHWLHVDYIHGTRGSQHRHPRHFAYVRDHVTDFRVLCAKHHYELTLTGKIEGTEITQ
ncbi:hypothetical protein NKJ52_20785 [Mesorhizobium australicum]|uniref:hypothetical protein n=1 Tax=Mesorhizobium australicum TaxID=536018 RepID=UPI003336F2D1